MLEWGQQNYPDQFKLGNVKAVKFKGKYYKFDFEQDPDIVDWLLNPLCETKAKSSNKWSDSSSNKNPIILANNYLQQQKIHLNPEDIGLPANDYLPRGDISSIEKNQPRKRGGHYFYDDQACMQEFQLMEENTGLFG